MSVGGVRGAIVEASWIATHVALYPLGVAQERAKIGSGRLSLEEFPPELRGLIAGDIKAATTPIVLVHGMVDNRSIFTVLGRSLRKRGFEHVLPLNHSPLISDVRVVAHELAGVIEQLCESTGYDRVHIVGHSMGGIVARYYVQRLGGDERVHTLVTLGAPHSGTVPASVIPIHRLRQLAPDSELMQELAEPAVGCRTRFVAVWSDLDQLIVPHENAQLNHPDLRVRNVLVRGVGHMSLPINSRVVNEIGDTLAHLERDGSPTEDWL
jgi:hypothetical protein